MSAEAENLAEKLLARLQEFLRLEAAGGLCLMATAALALVIANSPLAVHYEAFLALPFEIRLGEFGLAKPLLLWINDGLMAVFFFLVGMELKREVLEGHLSSLRRASLPAFAALGGMIVPAAIYAALNLGDATALQGWAIPTATDIAFALGVLSLLGPRVPAALKAFLLSVAIFDDLGAIIVIALFYTADLSWVALTIVGGLIAGLYVLNRAGVRRIAPYILIAIPLWVALLKSGVHATLAGVITALFIPLGEDSDEADAAASPLRELEHSLHPWVAFGVLPLFAFANAGVPLLDVAPTDLLHAVPLGIVAGLLLGKPIGILLFCAVAVRLRLAALAEGTNWMQLAGVAMLCGIGFTMSLFIASLAFEQGGAEYFGLERLGILVGSLVAGLAGYAALRISLRGRGSA